MRSSAVHTTPRTASSVGTSRPGSRCCSSPPTGSHNVMPVRPPSPLGAARRRAAVRGHGRGDGRERRRRGRHVVGMGIGVGVDVHGRQHLHRGAGDHDDGLFAVAAGPADRPAAGLEIRHDLDLSVLVHGDEPAGIAAAGQDVTRRRARRPSCRRRRPVARPPRRRRPRRHPRARRTRPGPIRARRCPCRAAGGTPARRRPSTPEHVLRAGRDRHRRRRPPRPRRQSRRRAPGRRSRDPAACGQAVERHLRAIGREHHRAGRQRPLDGRAADRASPAPARSTTQSWSSCCTAARPWVDTASTSPSASTTSPKSPATLTAADVVVVACRGEHDDHEQQHGTRTHDGPLPGPRIRESWRRPTAAIDSTSTTSRSACSPPWTWLPPRSAKIHSGRRVTGASLPRRSPHATTDPPSGDGARHHGASSSARSPVVAASATSGASSNGTATSTASAVSPTTTASGARTTPRWRRRRGRRRPHPTGRPRPRRRPPTRRGSGPADRTSGRRRRSPGPRRRRRAGGRPPRRQRVDGGLGDHRDGPRPHLGAGGQVVAGGDVGGGDEHVAASCPTPGGRRRRRRPRRRRPSQRRRPGRARPTSAARAGGRARDGHGPRGSSVPPDRVVVDQGDVGAGNATRRGGGPAPRSAGAAGGARRAR